MISPRITFHFHNAAGKELTGEEKHDAAHECVFTIDALALLLARLDWEQMRQIDPSSIQSAAGNLGRLFDAITSELLELLSDMERDRKRLIAMIPEKGGVQ
jgi:hypothetical protein